jgi:hypothetical protein
MGGPSGEVFYVKSSAQGSHHDTHVFRTSDVYEGLQNGDTPIENGIIFADSGYPSRLPYMATPFRDGTHDRREKKYNKKFNRGVRSVGPFTSCGPVLLRP